MGSLTTQCVSSPKLSQQSQLRNYCSPCQSHYMLNETCCTDVDAPIVQSIAFKAALKYLKFFYLVAIATHY